MTQYAFHLDGGKCTGCKTCQVACKETYKLPVSNLYRKVYNYQGGSWKPTEAGHYVPDGVFGYFVSLACNHCSSPACVANCPTGAMYKDDDGTVQHDDEACIGCQTCVNSCPYGAPQFIEEDKIVQKCDTCRALREAGHAPVCVEACPMRAIEFGEMDDLRAAHPDAVSELPCTEPAATTTPNILIGASRGALLEDFNPVVL